MLFSMYSQTENVQDPRVSLVNLSGPSENFTWAFLGKQNWRPPPVCGFRTPPCVHSKLSVCTSTTRTCWNTCARGTRIHGDVLNVHTEAFLNPHMGFSTVLQRAATHTHTPRPPTTPRPQPRPQPRPPRPQRHNITHNITRRQRKKREEKAEEERQDKNQKKIRQHEREEDERRQKKTRQDRKAREDERGEIRQDKTREGKIKRREKREEKRREKTKEKMEEKMTEIKRRWRKIELKRAERKDDFFRKNVSEPSNPSDELVQHVSKRNLFRTKFSSFFFTSSESYRVFHYLHDSNSIFLAEGIISETFFGRIVNKVSSPCLDDHHFKKEEFWISRTHVRCLFSHGLEMLVLGSNW